MIRPLLTIILFEAMATLATHMPESNRPSLMVESATLVEWSMSQVCALAVNVSGHQHCPGPIATELASFAPLSSSPSHV
jgi:hypothetical protein